MAVRIRAGGAPIVCAATHPEMHGDTYVDDGLHYRLSAEYGVLVAEPMDVHITTGMWWWFDEVPPGIEIEKRSRCSARAAPACCATPPRTHPQPQ